MEKKCQAVGGGTCPGTSYRQSFIGTALEPRVCQRYRSTEHVPLREVGELLSCPLCSSFPGFLSFLSWLESGTLCITRPWQQQQ